ncbi:pumilio-like protein 12-like [Senna tora]|uniref:Pumilio-like protein 12-like n=1 Tax=Senna tora TaxID=362788 RepID=A0A834SGV9_9FABA|nr:pumilio-like protein 12-like [Senna tora]
MASIGNPASIQIQCCESNSFEVLPATCSSPWTPFNPFNRERSVGRSNIEWDWLNYHESFTGVPYFPKWYPPCLWIQDYTDIDGGKAWLNQCDIVKEAGTQAGSIKLQIILAQNDKKITKIIFQNTFLHLQLIMTSYYGRYFFQALVDSCDLSLLDLIIARLTLSVEDLANLSCHPYGAQCLKRLINALPILDERSLSQAPFKFVTALSFRFYELMTNRTGSSIIQECLEVLSVPHNLPLYTELSHFCMDLATHERGCVSLNRALDYVDCLLTTEPISIICHNALQLAYHPYGHFVIQFILGMQMNDCNEEICQNLQGHYAALSTRKEGSHVVEKCLQSNSRAFALAELIWNDRLGDIASDRYGNHVLQTAIKETQVRALSFS